VLRNKEFSRLTSDEVQDTFKPKIEGNIYLHEVSLELGCPLDFFVMLSSLTSISHAATPSSYSAANCYMDEFARYRLKLGLAATSINLGVIGDVGFMPRHQQNMMHLNRNGHYITLSHELMALFGTALFRQEQASASELLENPVALGTEPTKLRALVDSGAVPVPLWGRDARWGIVGAHAMRKNQGVDVDGMRGSKGEIKDTVAERLAKLLWTPIENLRMDASLSSLSIDSMIASEFRHWMYQTFKKNVSMMELLAHDMTIEKLAAFLKE